ncbi:MAG: alanine dehydrogenase, partial [Chitinophagaceae bacterium]|nr:alanine dehydrogenase [Chitinophagaceae bacterium]
MATQQKPHVNVSFSYNPLEETLAYARKKNNLFIGIPKESSFQENRIALTPQAVMVLVSNGHDVVVEHQAGLAASFTDRDYSEAGAQIAYDKAAVFKAGIIVKTAPISQEELDLLQEDQLIFAPVHLPSMDVNMLQRCLNKKIIAVALGNIKDAAGTFPIVRSMSQIAGIHAVEIAAKYLSNQHGGRGILLGGIAGVPPANVVIIGAGMVGEYAARTALG